MLIHVSSHSVALKREWSRPTIQRLLESRRPGQDYRIPASRRSVSGYASRYKSVMNSRRFTDHLAGPSRSILSKVLPAPPVLPTEDSTPQNGKRLLHLSHVRRNEMSEITPPKIFSKEVAQNRPPPSARAIFLTPKIVSPKFPGMGPG